MSDGELKPLTRRHKATEIEDGNRGAGRTIDFTARQWAFPSVKEKENQPDIKKSAQTGLSLLPMAALNNQQKLVNAKCLQPDFLQWPVENAATSAHELPDLDMFLRRLKTHMFSISCMVFQDAWNLDLERVRDCCIHVLAPDGRLIPFCIYNLTDTRGKSLYRKS